MMSDKEIRRAAELCNKLQSSFQAVMGIAYDNAPDADQGAYEEFTDNMTDYENEFDAAMKELKAML